MNTPDLILYNGSVYTGDKVIPHVTAIAVAGGRIQTVGDDTSVMQLAGNNTTIIDLRKKRVIPGINDSHLHLIRGGLNYNLELRWDGVPSLSDALRMLKEQVLRTPSPQWVRVVGGWTEFQFAERRMPTLKEINEIAPDTPVFILHLYDRAFLNAAALRAVGYTRDTPAPPGGMIEKDANGNPNGLILATPNAAILYATLAKGPKLPYEQQVNSTRHFMREMNRLGITSVIDAGGGFQNYPEDYQVLDELHKKEQLTVRIAYNLFTQHPKKGWEDFDNWIRSIKPYQGDDMYRHNGAGEMLVFSAADFEDFLQPRPDLPDVMEEELEKVVRLLVANRWPFRLHATYDQSISRFLNVFEMVDRDIPFEGLTWILDHAETIGHRNIKRVKALGGGIAIQNRMAFQGEYFSDRYGLAAASAAPPVRTMLEMGVPVGGGTDATRVSSYNPWLGLYWLTTGNTIGGLQIRSEADILSREEALTLYTAGSAWFSNEQQKKGQLKAGQFADIAVLNQDYFAISGEDIKGIESELTIVGGRIVYASGDFLPLAPPPLPVMPDWSPTGLYNGYYPGSNRVADARSKQARAAQEKINRETAQAQESARVHLCSGACGVHGHDHDKARKSPVPIKDLTAFWGVLGCSCFAF